MVHIGYTMLTEQAGPRDLVAHVVGAERAGFDFSVTSDHYSAWLATQGHSPYAWSVLGAAAQATTRIPLMSYVTCPTTRYHPAVIAQKAATVQLLSEGRFRSGRLSRTRTRRGPCSRRRSRTRRLPDPAHGRMPRAHSPRLDSRAPNGFGAFLRHRVVEDSQQKDLCARTEAPGAEPHTDPPRREEPTRSA
ncbi:hypothetical protein XF35_19625 [Streptomyces platensis subsp. clarensis]|nr:hypothetical protein [Streptomyces platensis subsp. clarensis]